jgi:hypothetical protein
MTLSCPSHHKDSKSIYVRNKEPKCPPVIFESLVKHDRYERQEEGREQEELK